MLRWMSGDTKLDRIRHERIRGTTKVGAISKKVQESRFKWYGQVLRREEDIYVGKRVMAMDVRGKEGEGDQREVVGQHQERLVGIVRGGAQELVKYYY